MSIVLNATATHRVASTGTKREFNDQFQSLCQHYGLTPRTIGVACPKENGDVESSNGHLKRCLRQHLLLRGSRDFESEVACERFLHQVLERCNRPRQKHLAEELAVMKSLPATRLSEYDEVRCTVGAASTIRVKKVGYSVSARLIGQELKAEVYEREPKLYSGRELLLVLPRHCGDRGVVLNYRHVIDHLLCKPGAFERYRYREQLYPSRSFREAYDHLVGQHGPRSGAVEYLRLLKLASEVGESEVEFLLIEYLLPPHQPHERIPRKGQIGADGLSVLTIFAMEAVHSQASFRVFRTPRRQKVRSGISVFLRAAVRRGFAVRQILHSKSQLPYLKRLG